MATARGLGLVPELQHPTGNRSIAGRVGRERRQFGQRVLRHDAGPQGDIQEADPAILEEGALPHPEAARQVDAGGLGDRVAGILGGGTLEQVQRIGRPAARLQHEAQVQQRCRISRRDCQCPLEKLPGAVQVRPEQGRHPVTAQHLKV